MSAIRAHFVFGRDSRGGVFRDVVGFCENWCETQHVVFADGAMTLTSDMLDVAPEVLVGLVHAGERSQVA